MGRKQIKPEEDERALVGSRTYAGARKGAPQKRRADWRAFSKEQRDLFLSVLAETSNVSEACRRTGKSLTTVYRVRHQDPAFGEAWMQALEQGFAALEMEALRRTRFGQDVTEYRLLPAEEVAGDGGAGDEGSPGAVAVREQMVRRTHSYDGKLTIWLLSRYQEQMAAYRARLAEDASDGSQALEEIKRRLLAMKERAGRGDEE